MKEFFVNDPEDSQILLTNPNKDSVPVEAVDVIDLFTESRKSSQEAGNPREWHLYFQREFKLLTGLKIGKTDAVLLYREACELVNTLKKNGSDDLEQPDQSDTPPS